MNLPKICNLGTRFFCRVWHPLPVNSVANTSKLGFNNQCFYSSFCNSDRCFESHKLTLSSYNPFLFNLRGMKIKGSLSLRCKDCYFERKDGVMHVMCSSYPRHKQRARTKREKYTWILTFAFQNCERQMLDSKPYEDCSSSCSSGHHCNIHTY